MVKGGLYRQILSSQSRTTNTIAVPLYVQPLIQLLQNQTFTFLKMIWPLSSNKCLKNYCPNLLKAQYMLFGIIIKKCLNCCSTLEFQIGLGIISVFVKLNNFHFLPLKIFQFLQLSKIFVFRHRQISALTATFFSWSHSWPMPNYSLRIFEKIVKTITLLNQTNMQNKSPQT